QKSIEVLDIYLHTNVVYYFVVFFFQAEDGIRDLIVTGVQTCALPIYSSIPCWRRVEAAPRPGHVTQSARRQHGIEEWAAEPGGRSEERRVGKECRSRCEP